MIKGKEVSLSKYRHYTDICLEELGKNYESIRQDSVRFGGHQSWASLRHKSTPLLLPRLLCHYLLTLSRNLPSFYGLRRFSVVFIGVHHCSLTPVR